MAAAQLQRVSAAMPGTRRSRGLRIEPLESRHLLSLLGVEPAAPSLVFGPGTLQYTAGSSGGILTIDAVNEQGVSFLPASGGTPTPLFSSPGVPGSPDLHIAVQVDGNGNLLGGNPNSGQPDIEVDGNAYIAQPGGGYQQYASPLLTGTVAQFGFGAGGSPSFFDFRFTITGGSLESDYFAGADLGVVASSLNANFAGNFGASFSGTVQGTIGAIAPLLRTMIWQGAASGTWTGGPWTNAPPAYPGTTANVVLDTPDNVQVTAAETANSLQISSGQVLVAAGGSLTVTADAGVTADGVLNVNPAGAFSSGGTFTLDTGGSACGGSISAAAFQLNDGTASADLSGPGGLTKDTSGTVTLCGTNTYSGGTTVKAGLLRAEGSGAIPASSLLAIDAQGSVVLGAQGYAEPEAASGGQGGGGIEQEAARAVGPVAAPAVNPAAASAPTVIAAVPLSAPPTQPSAPSTFSTTLAGLTSLSSLVPPGSAAQSPAPRPALPAAGILFPAQCPLLAAAHDDVLQSAAWALVPTGAESLDGLSSLQGGARLAKTAASAAAAADLLLAGFDAAADTHGEPGSLGRAWPDFRAGPFAEDGPARPSERCQR
jgi:autotransporter-associated beta strand protein